ASSGAKALLVTKQVRPIIASVLDTGAVEKLITVESLKLDAPREGTEPAVAPEDICFLQYTSGSTSAPKGVVVTHANLSANCWAIMDDVLSTDYRTDHAVSWLPLYHDMGLIGFVISPVFDAISVTFIPTMEFVKKPSFWLETISKKRATITFAPNFAYALVARRVRDSEASQWDLSCMKWWGCGAEPIQPQTFRDFLAKLAPAKINPESLLPCYGMAEATLIISHANHAGAKALRVDRVDIEAFRQGEAKPFNGDESPNEPPRSVEVVNCGKPIRDHEVVAMDEEGNILPERAVGELCFKGPSVAGGYYKNPEATAAAFKGEWLHSGDKGYVANGDVYVCGRIKDLIIINGRNYYPTDIEWTVNDLEGVRRGSAVAFATLPASASSEHLVVVAEWAGKDKPSDAAMEATRKLVKEKVQADIGLNVHDVALIPPGTVPKTSSGKLQRRKTKQQYEDGTLGQEAPTTDSMQAKAAVAKQVARSYVSLARSEVMSRLPDPVRAIFGKKKG
ncbi:MAG: fatty acyl-AMP ligase, partial [Polyangiales bacterium]